MRALLGIGILGLALTTAVHADARRPFYLQVIESGSAEYRVEWKQPADVRPDLVPKPLLPIDCIERSRKLLQRPDGDWFAADYSCDTGLGGRAIQVIYPRGSELLSTILRTHWRSGEEKIGLFTPEQSQIVLPENGSHVTVARDYMALGVKHIWEGVDHLLFVACLLWIAGSWPRILVTITGFTAAHSLTLSLAALQVIALPVPPVEATIALSILFLAVEIARGRRENSITWRHPIAVSTTFGLLHGLGFAAALSDVGLPQVHVLTGLLFFNLGVEMGQVMFAGSLLLAIALARRLTAAMPRFDVQRSGSHWAALRLEHSAAYAIGIVSSFWFFQRLAAMALS